MLVSCSSFSCSFRSFGGWSSPVALFSPRSLGGAVVSGARGSGSSAWCLFGGFSRSGSLVLSVRSCAWVRSARSARLSVLSAPRPLVVRSLSALLSVPLGFSRPVVLVRSSLPGCAGRVVSALARSGVSLSAPGGGWFRSSSFAERRAVVRWLVSRGVV